MNNRPVFILALCLAPGIILGRYLDSSIIYITAAAVLCIAAFCLLKRKWAVILLGGAFLLLGVFLSSSTLGVDYIETKGSMRIEGRITEQPNVSEYGDTVIVLDNASIEGQKTKGIKLYYEGEGEAELKPGDVIETTADVEIPPGVRNPGGYNQKLQYAVKGIYYKAYSDGKVIKTGEKSGILILAAKARAYIGAVVDEIFEDDVQGVAKAMLLGEKQDIDEEVYSTFRDTGMAHVLAVSGLHAGILIGALYYLLRLLRAGRTLRLAVTLAFVILYAFVTGLTPSIVRASVMAAAILLGSYFGRQQDSLNYLSIAFIVSLLINPLSLFSTSFMLSFGAVFAITTLGWQLKRWLDRHTPAWMGKPNGMISMSVGAAVGTLPFLALKFNRISTLSILTNILIIPFASVAIITVFITTAAGLVFRAAGVWLAYVSGFFVRVLMQAIDWIAGIPFIAVNTASPPWYIILAVFLILFVSSKYMLIKTWIKSVVCAGAAAAVVLTVLLSVPAGMHLVFLDVGHADAAFIKTQHGGEYFIDGGREQSAEEIIDFTIRNGYTPDAAFVSHSDADHFCGIKALYEKGLLKKVYCSYQEKDYIKAEMPDAEVVALSAGDIVWLDKDTKATVLYPKKDTQADEKNDASLVLLVEYEGHSVLFAGDISGYTETLLFTQLGEVDIYKAAHHGSKYSSYELPLSALSPQYSVVSAGYNNFGHPHEYAMANLEEYSDEVYTTIDDYAVEFIIGKDIKVRTYGDLDG